MQDRMAIAQPQTRSNLIRVAANTALYADEQRERHRNTKNTPFLKHTSIKTITQVRQWDRRIVRYLYQEEEEDDEGRQSHLNKGEYAKKWAQYLQTTRSSAL